MGTFHHQCFKREDGMSITFHIISLTEDECQNLTLMIEALGGAVEHNADGEIVFTEDRPDVVSSLSGKRVYNIQYIRDCIDKQVILDPTHYRIGPRDDGDHRAMHVFFYGWPASPQPQR